MPRSRWKPLLFQPVFSPGLYQGIKSNNQTQIIAIDESITWFVQRLVPEERPQLVPRSLVEVVHFQMKVIFDQSEGALVAGEVSLDSLCHVAVAGGQPEGGADRLGLLVVGDQDLQPLDVGELGEEVYEETLYEQLL